ncbi:uncharacterized protein LOC121238121 [Juglans microcarpa x Juglans regia]|uniref:uncharacterized protein LOC121238121 n=1 Tax=Juglans microcarpa x Juglans regia TaxID=2249226 RepID=UPI001B7DEC19|nr:uncharacterized protein LOC121238121 [Juglans microcarpa x Juglans regia]
MKTEAALSVPVLEVLDAGNYVDWRVRVKTYLMAQDLWDIVEGTTESPRQEEDEAAFKTWCKRDSMALHVIQIACGADAFSAIREIRRENRPENNDFIPFLTLREAVRNGEWKGVKDFLEKRPDAVTAKIEVFGRTPLQVAILAGHMHIVEKLVERMSEEELKTVDDEGFTALAEATCGGNYQMAKCILKKNKSLVRIANINGDLPVVLAIVTGHVEFARYLYSLTPIEDLKPENGIIGAAVCTRAIHMGALGKSIQSASTSSPYETRLSINPDQVRNPEMDDQVKHFGHTVLALFLQLVSNLQNVFGTYSASTQ